MTTYEKFDSCYAKVTGSCRSGAFLTLDNGEKAFAYKFASLRPESVVLCSVQKLAKEDKVMQVSVDAALYYPPLPAS